MRISFDIRRCHTSMHRISRQRAQPRTATARLIRYCVHGNRRPDGPLTHAGGGTMDDSQQSPLDPEEIIARGIANRGEIFEEFKIFIREIPRAYAINQQVAGYVHQYKNTGTADQV